MIEFSYARPEANAAAMRLAGASPGAKHLGGANLVDVMRETVERPGALVDVTGPSTAIEAREDGSIPIGAGVRNTAGAADRAVRTRFPALARAILAGASGQIRVARPAGERGQLPRRG